MSNDSFVYVSVVNVWLAAIRDKNLNNAGISNIDQQYAPIESLNKLDELSVMTKDDRSYFELFDRKFISKVLLFFHETLRVSCFAPLQWLPVASTSVSFTGITYVTAFDVFAVDERDYQ